MMSPKRWNIVSLLFTCLSFFGSVSWYRIYALPLVDYRYDSINRPGRLLNFWIESGRFFRGGRLFEAGRLLYFHHFQQVKYVSFATKQ